MCVCVCVRALYVCVYVCLCVSICVCVCTQVVCASDAILYDQENNQHATYEHFSDPPLQDNRPRDEPHPSNGQWESRAILLCNY